MNPNWIRIKTNYSELNKNKMNKLVESELSYKIIGFCMGIHSSLGKSLKEKFYQEALQIILEENKINFKQEIKVDLLFNSRKIGYYFLDFLVDDKVVLELKAKPNIDYKDIKQVLSYLEATSTISFASSSLEASGFSTKIFLPLFIQSISIFFRI